ncbi:PREDICTED: WD repeat-containing protein 81-like isoform X2 [Priapulus caudatus]|uniref:WD repeat-containing protein 81-like isoform X2 n=1 Tax=Priapulus caudatus TaxID=37621 RepID=A0ABM1EG17_PRICU|nr:PREDICTED: WD repeat-containing protein 81-like isoform X2 [Priapulus caudatus]
MTRQLQEVLTEVLGLSTHQCNIGLRDGTETAVCLVNKHWLEQLMATGRTTDMAVTPELSDCLVFLHSSQTPVHPWCRITVRCIPITTGFIEIPMIDSEHGVDIQDNLYSSAMTYVDRINCRNLLMSAMNKFNQDGNPENKEYKGHEDYITETLRSLYDVTPIEGDKQSDFQALQPGNVLHPNLLPPLIILRSRDCLCLVYPYVRLTLENAVLFSPGLFTSSNAKPLFVSYQLLRLLQACHLRRITVGNLTLTDIAITDVYWIHTNEANVFSIPMLQRPPNGSCVPDLMQLWVEGLVSNYDYLMALNRLAGRRAGDPNHHPILPWVSDFTSPDSGWRDLTRSKFRLNKGDRQLDLTYEGLQATQLLQRHTGVATEAECSTMPHHVTDFLSDITYYVYKARQTSKDILCKHVRSKWVPHEYPSSMQRIWEWTPDECIPEFYTDPAIFHSVHDDLPDLEVPLWSESCDVFVHWHRAMLESAEVSQSLHHWIDLTFGYKLAGKHAVKAKNVCRHLAEQRHTMSNHGIVQLFTEPHPRRSSRTTAAHLECAVAAATVVDSMNNEGKSPNMSDEQNQNGCIMLPPDYEPLRALDEVERLHKFTSALAGKEMRKPDDTETSCEDHCPLVGAGSMRDIQVLGCLIAELFLGARMKAAGTKPTLKSRCELIRKLYRHDRFIIPRCFHRALETILQLDTPHVSYAHCADDVDDMYAALFMHKPMTESDLPPMPGQLLHPLLSPFLFPSYFTELYSIVQDCCAFDAYTSMLYFPVAHVKVSCRRLGRLLPLLDAEGIELVVPYVVRLLEQRSTAAYCAWSLLNVTGEALGPRDTARYVMRHLVALYDSDCATSKHVKFYHRSFLLQLIVRLGLQCFLANFSTLLVEAVSGYKDYQAPEQAGTPIGTMRRSVPAHLMQSSVSIVEEESDAKYEEEYKKRADVVGESPGDASEFADDASSRLDAQEEQRAAAVTAVSCTHTSAIHRTADTFIDDMIIVYNDADDCEMANVECISIHGVPNIAAQERSAANINRTESMYNIVCDSDEGLCGGDSGGGGLDEQLPDDIIFSLDPDWLSHDSIMIEKQGAEEQGGGGGKRDVLPLIEVLQAMPPTKAVSRFLLPGAVEYNVSDAATESVLWLAHRLGPMLTAKYLTRNLLHMLTLCYIGEEQLQFAVGKADGLSVSSRLVVGDENARKILECLTSIATLYGEHIILLQYLPYIRDVVKAGSKHVSPSTEAALIASMVIFKHAIPYLSDIKIMDNLQELFTREILLPLIRILSSINLRFPNSSHAREVLCLKFLDVVYIIAMRIGFEMTRRYLTALLQRFFLSFDTIHRGKLPGCEIETTHPESCDVGGDDELDEVILQQITDVFSPQMAHTAYIPFCRLAGGLHMEQNLPNDELIRRLCEMHDTNMTTAGEASEFMGNTRSTLPDSMHDSFSSSGQFGNASAFGKNVAVCGNRIDLQEDRQRANSRQQGLTDMPSVDHRLLVSTSMENQQRHLRGNWLAYWEHEVGRSEKDNRFAFKQIKLQTFVGHSSSVRSIVALDNENSFLSASKDRTVKLWSLRSQGDGSACTPCQWTYTGHRKSKSVFAVAFLESMRLAASCDGSVHIWDPFMGSCLQQYDSAMHAPITALHAMPPPSPTFIVGTTDATLRFIDCRQQRYLHDYKVTTVPAGFIRSIAVSPNSNWIAVGLTSGVISVLDTRTGMLLGTWKGHDSDILQVKCFNSNHFVTTSLDHHMSLWSADTCLLVSMLSGQAEAVHLLGFYKNDMISGSTDNRIGVHSNLTGHGTSYSSVRLRSDVFRGMLTAMTVLPLNRLLLLGADNGTIRLLY